MGKNCFKTEIKHSFVFLYVLFFFLNYIVTMNFIDMVNFFISLIHTFIRFLPLGLYFFTYLSTALFKDLRAAILMMGLIVNDIIGFLYKKYAQIVPNAPCAIFGKVDNKTEIGFLPNPHTEVISFVASFFYSDMYYKSKLDLMPFSFITIMLFLTIWSRVTVGCKKMKDVLFNLVFGAVRGILFYYFVSKYYLHAERGIFEKETCDLGYNNYRCDEIKEGTVIIKEGSNGSSDDDKDDE